MDREHGVGGAFVAGIHADSQLVQLLSCGDQGGHLSRVLGTPAGSENGSCGGQGGSSFSCNL